MMLVNFPAGPFIHALAWTTPDYEVLSADSGNCQDLPVPVHFHAGVPPRRTTGRSFVEMTADLPVAVLRASGVPRARSAARSAVFGALVARELARSVNGTPQYQGDRMGVAVVSSSCIIPIFFKFEGVGVSDSWNNTDTTLLPGSIPSAVGTAASMVTHSHAGALTFGDGAFGMCAAVEHAFLAFHHDRADFFMLLGAEEATEPMRDALLMMDDPREIMDGSAGVILSRFAVAPTDWQICAMAIAPPSEKVYIAEPWGNAPRVRVTLASRLTAYTSMLLPFALHKAMTCDEPVAIVELQAANRGTILLALRRQTGPVIDRVFA